MTGIRSGFDEALNDQKESVRRILAVCTANRCRSPMLAAVLRDRLARAGMAERVIVSSAGLLAREGAPVDPAVADLVDRRGLALEKSESRQARNSDFRNADLILVATEQHRTSIFHWSPEDLYKVVLLSELVGESHDLADPIGLSPAEYRRTFAEIERCVDDGWDRLCRLLAL